MHMHDTCTHCIVCRGQRRTFGTWFSPFTVWALEIQEGSEAGAVVRLGGKYLYLLNHLAGPVLTPLIGRKVRPMLCCYPTVHVYGMNSVWRWGSPL